MTGTYDLKLVALSLIVAVFASYTALELAGRVSQRKGKGSWVWLFGGAVSMGTGIWSMHFIGMLAFKLPVSMEYDAGITLLSMAIAVLASGIALYIVRRPAMTVQNLFTGGTLMGIGISAMHYTGMYAMRMSPPIRYDPELFVASVLIAITASLAALWIAFKLRKSHFSVAIMAKHGSAVVMGLAITGMHYTAMAAAEFATGSVSLADNTMGSISNSALAVTIGVISIVMLIVTLGIAAIDAQYAQYNARLAESLKEANENLLDIAFYDNLTGLPNRVLLDDRVMQTAKHAERNKSHFALMFVDLDQFKPVNDTYGHEAGDALLRSVASRLSACVRDNDTVARAGGDEFIIILNEIDNPKNAGVVSSKILDELSRPFTVTGHEIVISGSIGISIYPEDGKDIAMLKSNADIAMYQSKKEGRNKFTFFRPELTID